MNELIKKILNELNIHEKTAWPLTRIIIHRAMSVTEPQYMTKHISTYDNKEITVVFQPHLFKRMGAVIFCSSHKFYLSKTLGIEIVDFCVGLYNYN